MKIFVVVARHRDGSDVPSLIAAFGDEDAANGVVAMIEQTSPDKAVEVMECPLLIARGGLAPQFAELFRELQAEGRK